MAWNNNAIHRGTETELVLPSHQLRCCTFVYSIVVPLHETDACDITEGTYVVETKIVEGKGGRTRIKDI